MGAAKNAPHKKGEKCASFAENAKYAVKQAYYSGAIIAAEHSAPNTCYRQITTAPTLTNGEQNHHPE